MKRIFTLLTAITLGSASFGQVFQSDLSTWANGEPADWTGSKTSIGAGGSTIAEVSTGANYGTSVALLTNDNTSSKRLATEPTAVTAGETYEIKMWVSAVAGEMTTRIYDLSNSDWGTFNSNYIDVAGSTNLMISQTVTIPAGCTSVEFMLYVRNTGTTGIALDSVDINTVSISYTAKTIAEIQTSTAGPSPEAGNHVETAGVVTATKTGGYWIQDGNGAWSGVYIDDAANTPSIGDSVTVQGQVGENFDATQLENVVSYTLESAPVVVPTATVLPTADIKSMEEYEGVLVQTINAICTDASGPFGQWTINTDVTLTSDSLLVDDDIFNFGAQVFGTAYNVTGIAHYSYGDRKILPRMASDIAEPLSVEKNTINANIFPNPATNNVTISGVNGTISIYAINGEVVYNGTINNTLNVNTQNLTTGLYIVEVIENNVKANYKLIVE